MAQQEHFYGAEPVPANGISRRKLMATGATLAVAGAAVGVAGTAIVSSVGGSAVAADGGAPGADEPVMAYLKNAQNGLFEVYVGEKHTTFTDKGLADQVTQAASRAE